MTIDILTLFPKELESSLHGLIKRARDSNKVKVNFINIRDFTHDNYHSVDDRPYGGGKGMILKCQPLVDAIHSVKQNNSHVILLDPIGKKYNQKEAIKLSKLKHLILICGHYEGVDQRIKKYFIDESISVGDYVLTGGEYPALIIADSIIRLLPGILKEGVTENESFRGKVPTLEYPQYTRPEVFKGHKVPKVLVSGNHNKIEKWKNRESMKITKKLRPDLLKI